MCFELYKFVIIPLILNSCQLTRLDHKCWPLDNGTHLDLCSLLLQGSLYGLYMSQLGIVTGNPQVFQGYPDPDPVRTHTRPLGMGFAGYRYGYPSGHTDMRRVGSMGRVGCIRRVKQVSDAWSTRSS